MRIIWTILYPYHNVNLYYNHGALHTDIVPVVDADMLSHDKSSVRSIITTQLSPPDNRNYMAHRSSKKKKTGYTLKKYI